LKSLSFSNIGTVEHVVRRLHLGKVKSYVLHLAGGLLLRVVWHKELLPIGMKNLMWIMPETDKSASMFDGACPGVTS
jgi:hypothetical protein